MPAPRHAIVLTAGLGTRLRPLTDVRAKPAMPVAGVPMVRRIVEWLAGNGVTELVLNLHHLPATLTRIVGDGADLGANIRYSWEPVVLGSAGGPKQAAAILGASEFLLVNGDTLTDVDLRKLASAHERANALVTLALVPNTEPLRYGGVLVDTNGDVTGFVRRGPAAAGSFHFVGVQIAREEAFRSAPAGAPSASIGGIYDALIAAAPGSIRGFVCDASFFEVGTVADYVRASRAFGASSTGDVFCGRNPQIASTARVTRSILWDDVHVGADSVVDECVVTDGVHIPDGAIYRRAAIVRLPGERGDLIVAPIAE
ncbi:MAG TPA: NDP-sugar synthase [Vicinamibacterales bacterium]